MAEIDLTEDVRLAVYGAFRRTGRSPSRSELATTAETDVATVDEALARLHATRDLVLGENAEIVMAHPFTAVPLGFSVMGEHRLWWGGCAWDFFAIPHLLPEEPRVLVATTCPACERPLAWSVTADAPPPGDEVAHFLTPTSHI